MTRTNWLRQLLGQGPHGRTCSRAEGDNLPDAKLGSLTPGQMMTEPDLCPKRKKRNSGRAKAKAKAKAKDPTRGTLTHPTNGSPVAPHLAATIPGSLFTPEEAAPSPKGARTQSDGGRGAQSPTPLADLLVTIQNSLEINNATVPFPLYNGPRSKVQEWTNLGADNVLLAAIKEGIKSPLHKLPPPHPPISPRNTPRRSKKPCGNTSLKEQFVPSHLKRPPTHTAGFPYSSDPRKSRKCVYLSRSRKCVYPSSRSHKCV